MLINTPIINTEYRYRLKQAFDSIAGNTVVPNWPLKKFFNYHIKLLLIAILN